MSQYVRHPELRLTEVDGEGVVLHLGTRKYFTVNETALLVLNRLRSPQTREALVEAIRAEYEVSEAEAGTEVDALLDRGVAASLVMTIRQE